MPRKTRLVHKRKAATVDDALRAWDLRTQGLSLRAIQRELGLSCVQQASNLVERGFKDFYSPKVEQRRSECDSRQLQAIEQLSKIAFSKRKSVKNDARIAALGELRKWDRENRMLHGLDAPEASVQLVGAVEVKDARSRLLDRLDALAEQAAKRAASTESH